MNPSPRLTNQQHPAAVPTPTRRTFSRITISIALIITLLVTSLLIATPFPIATKNSSLPSSVAGDNDITTTQTPSTARGISSNDLKNLKKENPSPFQGPFSISPNKDDSEEMKKRHSKKKSDPTTIDAQEILPLTTTVADESNVKKFENFSVERANSSFGDLCNLTAGRPFLDLWRAQRVRKTLAGLFDTTTTAAVVDTYEFPWHEYTPTVKVCYDCVFGSIFDKNELFAPFFAATTPPAEKMKRRVFLRFRRYMPFFENPYEGFHAIFSAFVVMKLLSLSPSSTQLVFLDTDGMSAADTFLWSALSDFPPLMASARSEAGANVSGRVARVVTITSSTATSLLCTKDRFGVFKGRGIDHHCGSPLFGELVEVIRAKAFEGTPRPALEKQHDDNDLIFNVIWSQRRGANIKRKLHKEAEFLAKLQEKLNKATLPNATPPGLRCVVPRFPSSVRFNVTAMDFAATPIRDVIHTVSTTANAMVGIHGAGLLFSAFMARSRRWTSARPDDQTDQRHDVSRSRMEKKMSAPLLIELFGKDRLSNNKHYHNMLSLLPNNHTSYAFTDVGDSMFFLGPSGSVEPAPWYDKEADREDVVQWAGHVVDDVARYLLNHFLC